MKLSFSTRGWPSLSFDKMMDIASEMGFSGIEVYNLTKIDSLVGKGGAFHKYNVVSTVRQLRDKGIFIPCFDTSLDISSVTEASTKEDSSIVSLILLEFSSFEEISKKYMIMLMNM